jgi:hypothetical protein
MLIYIGFPTKDLYTFLVVSGSVLLILLDKVVIMLREESVFFA